MSHKQYSFGLNTRNISTSNRTTAAVMVGSLKGGSKGSTSRIYKWCNRHCPADPIACVFQQSNTPAASKSSWTNIDVSQLNLGEITGNMGLNGQTILGGSNGGQLQYSTNLGNSWAPYTGSPNLPGGITGIGWSSVVMSDDTKFVVGTPYVPDTASSPQFSTYNGVHYRRDSAGWFLLQSCPLEGGGTLNFNETGRKLLFIASGISQNGNYMAALTTPRDSSGELVYLIFSGDAGANWSAKAFDPYTQDLVTTVTSSISICDSVNDYFLITSKLYYNSTIPIPAYENGTLCVSGNGSAFTVPSDVSGNDFIFSSMSNSGQYQVVVTATNPQPEPPPGNTSIPSRLYLSSNSGTSFSQIIQLPYTDDNNYFKFGGVSMSYNGSIITASVLNQDDNFQYIYLSSDTGVTWKKIYNDSNGLPINISGLTAGFLNTSGNTDNSGQYQMLTAIDKLYINNNYGN